MIISYSQPSRERERFQFFNEESKTGDGWARFLHLNYIEYENDIILPNQLLSLAKLQSENRDVRKTGDGYFKDKDISTYSAWKIPFLGGMYLYQYIASLSFDVDIILHAQLEADVLAHKLRQKPKVIGISTSLILNPIDILGLVRYCRSMSPGSFIVLGGSSVWNSYLVNKGNPKKLMSYEADAVIVDGKGFKTFGRIVDCIVNNKPLNDIPNLYLYKNGSFHVTPVKPETFSFKKNAINWDYIDESRIGRIFNVRTQISCPFSCSYCSYPTSEGAVIQSDMDSLESELTELQRRGVKHILFIDDTFNVPIQRFKRMLNILKKYDFSWYAFIRCQYLDKQQVIEIKQSGCNGAYLGIESGNNDILKKMNKKITLDQCLKGIELLNSQNIPTQASFIVGFPGETDSTFQDTMSFIKSIGIDYYNVKIFYYDTTTPIAMQSADYGLKGHGMHWEHNTMTSIEAFDRTEDMIRAISNATYIPQHGGEIWEIAYLNERGFSKDDLKLLYTSYTKMLQDQLSGSADKQAEQQRLFDGLVEMCRKKTED
jgi:p-methyltransferase